MFLIKEKWYSSEVNFLKSSSSGGSNGVVSNEKIDELLLIGGRMVISSPESASSRTVESTEWALSASLVEEAVLFMDLVTLLDILVSLSTCCWCCLSASAAVLVDVVVVAVVLFDLFICEIPPFAVFACLLWRASPRADLACDTQKPFSGHFGDISDWTC